MPKHTLRHAFNLKETNEIVAIVGGGGKTSLMFALAHSLPGRIVATTTTRIFAAQMKLAAAAVFYPAAGAGDAEFFATVSEELDKWGQCLVIGEVGEQQEKAFGVPLTLPGQMLAQPDVDFVLVEADGSRMRPIKAPAAHEPVIPPDSTLVVPVVGMDALTRPLSEIAHRPEKIEELLMVNPATSAGQVSPWSRVNEMLTPKAVAQILTHPLGGLKGVPAGARVIPLLNKVERDAPLAAAQEIAQLILHEPRIERVVLGAMQAENPVVEVWGRITAVVLAAGKSTRMGQTKPLLPWGETTILGQLLQNLKASTVHDIRVISGHDADAVEAVAQAEQIHSIRNTEYASGEMLSSLQTAVRHLPAHTEAILVMLADQPLVTPATIDLLLTAFRQGQGDIIAPIYAGQRGNPVLISRRFFNELLALPAGSAPRKLLRSNPDAVHLVETADESILINLNDPETYKRWRP
ncbi:MAG: putative selenium-dependent hydroxylase accessory protein YqeC [Chloroflexi bacterium]|nr:MAG: putative selenium-dependent hydroxylase accessory protein YqeC [Chloroflexota bacterium]